MPKADVINREGKVTSQLELSEQVFGAPYRPALIHQVVVGYLANQRQGNASTKTRTEVRGGGRKPFRQKGTGRARQGTSRSPLMRGGGVTFGPKPRSYRVKLPRKIRRAALCSVLSKRLGDGEILFVDQFGIEEPKTRQVAQLLRDFQLEGERKVLLVLDDHDPQVLRAGKNIPGLFITNVGMLNAHDLTMVDRLVLTEAAAKKLQEAYS